MAKKKPVVAICYDFDGTLSPGNMQEYGFFSGLGKEAENFWSESTEHAKRHNADPILAYMNHMIEKAKIGDIRTTRQAFRTYGKSVELFDGVIDWFDRVNAYAGNLGIATEHYIVSSGLKEMIEGTAIWKKFKKIYACSFIYDNNDAAKWPAIAVNYTTKTQFLFRINKGIEDDNDNKKINEYVPEAERRIPFSRMIYIGDGLTDIPCMKLVKDKGGYSIAVYDSTRRGKRKETDQLLKDGRVNYVSDATYGNGTRMERLVFAIMEDIASACRLTSIGSQVARRKDPSKHDTEEQ